MRQRPSYKHLYGGPSLNSLLYSLLPEELRAAPLDEIDCNGFLTREQLERICVAVETALREIGTPYCRVLDLGCGTGGLARYLSTYLGRGVVGIDSSCLAIARARKLTSAFPSVDYLVCDFSSIDVRAASVAAIVSLDALYLAENPHAALTEAGRIIAPGGLLIFTTYSTAAAQGLSDNQWCALAEADGFEVLTCMNCTGEWRDLMWRKHQSRLASKNVVYQLLGERAEAELLVSNAMIGRSGTSFISATARTEITLRRL